MYPNLDFWFENKPSGNPGREPKKKKRLMPTLQNNNNVARAVPDILSIEI
jgi:hypothetical protein